MRKELFCNIRENIREISKTYSAYFLAWHYILRWIDHRCTLLQNIKGSYEQLQQEKYSRPTPSLRTNMVQALQCPLVQCYQVLEGGRS